MAPPPLMPTPNTFLKTVMRKIISLLKYPFKISGQISAHQYGVNKIITILKYSHGSDNFKQLYGYILKDNFIKWTYIYLPILLAFVSFGSLAYMNNKKNYTDYYTLLTLPVQETRVMAKISKYSQKVYYAFKYFPATKTEASVFGFFYFMAILGARFAAQHPALIEQNRIQQKLLDDKKVDSNGNPWLVVWTEYAILVKTYGSNEDKLFNDASFWTDINFPRIYPKVENQKDMQLMVFAKKQEVNKDMKYNFNKYLNSLKMKENSEKSATPKSRKRKG